MIFKNSDEVKNNSYINKDFLSLWEELLDLIPKITNKWDPKLANESDPLATLLKVLAIFSDKLNYNIDKSILERFPQTLTELRSAKNVYDTLGYKAPWYKAASGNVTFSYINKINGIDGDGEYDFYIPRFTQVCDEDSSILYVLTDREILGYKFSDASSVNKRNKTREVMLGKIKDYEINGVSQITANYLDQNNRLYFVEPNVAQNGIFIDQNPNFTDDNLWVLVDNIYQTLQDKSYEFGIDPVSGACYIEFPDNIANTIGEGLYIKYIVTDGENGNVKARSIVKYFDESVYAVNYNISNNLVAGNLDSVTNSTKFAVEGEDSTQIIINEIVKLSNSSAIQNGRVPATIDEMYKNYKKVRNTFDTLVTLLDYENFIFMYEKNNGQNVVSNIRVSDRTNDLFDSYKVWTIDRQNEVLKSKVIERDDSDDESTMGYADINFYPLNPIGPEGIQNKIDYENTFKNNSFFDNGNANQDTFGSNDVVKTDDSLISIVRDVKSLNVEVGDLPKDIITIDYDIEGQIYLNHKVSKIEADEIENNVKIALYKAFNSRELEFGDPLYYNKVLETIQNTDSRISYVALTKIEPTNINIPNNLTMINGLGTKEDAIVERSILNGNSPWADFYDNFNFKASLEAVRGGITSFTSPVTITSGVILDNKEQATSYTVAENEDFVAFAPEYKDIKTYSNYLFYVVENNEDTIICNADTPVISYCNIYFYQTKDKLRADFTGGTTYNPNPKNYSYEIKSNSKIRTNFLLKSTSYINQYNSPYSLNNGNIISEIGYNEGPLAEEGVTIEWCTNSLKLIDSLTSHTTWDSNGPTIYAYTLMTGEYFIYRIKGEVAFTLLGEGNTIGCVESLNIDEDIINTWFSQNWESIIEGYGVSNFKWAEFNGNEFHYRLNQIYIFGEGYIFSFSSIQDDSSDESSTDSFIGWVGDGTVFPIGSNFEYKESLSATPQKLPSLLGEDIWKGFIRLSYLINNTSEFKLTYVSNSGSNENIVTHIPYLEITSGDTTYPYPADNDNPVIYLQSNLQIESPGALTVILNEDLIKAALGEGNNFEIYSYKKADVESSYLFEEISGTWTSPMTTDDVIIAVVRANTDNVEIRDSDLHTSVIELSEANKDYAVIFKGGTEFEILDGASIQISNLKIASKDSEYFIYKYIDDSNEETLESFLGEELIKLLTVNELGDIEFNPTHIISKNNLIENPLSGDSYFNKNHPLNRYVLPKINNLDRLLVNQFSINS